MGWGTVCFVLPKPLDFLRPTILFPLMLRPRLLATLLCFGVLVSQGFSQTTVQGEPFGYVKVNIAAGTGTGKRTTFVSIPLLEDASITGKATGRITGVGTTTITAAGAGWTPGQLSAAATPFLLEITSGVAQGRMLLVSTAAANTADTITIAPEEATRTGNLANLGIVAGAENGDTYRIRPVDTLSSFFGTPETTLIRGGTSSSTADTITIVSNGQSVTYFYNTGVTPNRWSRVALGNPDASNTPIPPYAGVQYARLANTPLEFIVTGKVPSGQREVSIKNSGTTILAPFWPVTQTLAQLALQNTPNWLKASAATSADTIVLSAAGSTTTFFHDGTNWRRSALGNPVANTNTVPVGAAIMINKRSQGGAGYAAYENTAPYNLQ